MESPTIVTIKVKATLKISLAPDADIEEVLTNMDYNFTTFDGGTVVDTEITDWHRTDNEEDEDEEDEVAQDFLVGKEILP